MSKALVPFLVVSISFLAPHTVRAQDIPQREDTFIALVSDVLYSRRSPGFGGGLAFGYGSGAALGAQALYIIDLESVYSLEVTVFARYYLRGFSAFSGPFLQLNAGVAMFDHLNTPSFPARIGDLSASLKAGWRFLLGNHFFIEPAIRAGYPYIAGAGISAGFRL